MRVSSEARGCSLGEAWLLQHSSLTVSMLVLDAAKVIVQLSKDKILQHIVITPASRIDKYTIEIISGVLASPELSRPDKVTLIQFCEFVPNRDSVNGENSSYKRLQVICWRWFSCRSLDRCFKYRIASVPKSTY